MFQFCSLSAFAASPVPVGHLTVPAGETAAASVELPAGADLLRVTADWSPVSGDPKSNQLQLTVLAPDGVTGFASFFDNALSDASTPVSGLTASPRLTSQGGAGEYTLEFTNTSEHPIALDNITAELRALLDSIEISGAINPDSPTFERPNEEGSPSGLITRYSATTFTPEFSGTYTIHTSFTYDGVLVLYEGDQSEAPFADFIAANDESPGGLFSSFLQLTLTAGQPYTIVGTSYSQNVSGNFTHRIRFSGPVEPETPVEPLITFGAYRDFYATGGPSDDDNGNGLANLLEYALGRTPTDLYVPPLTTFLRDDRPVVRFYRDPDLTDIAYVVEQSSNLADWTEVYNSATEPGPNADGDFQEYEAPTAPTGPVFFRLVIRFLEDLVITSFADYQIIFGTGGPLDDDNGNGLANLLEYALGRTPSDPYSPPFTTFTEDDFNWVRFYRDPDLTDITYIVERTTDLTTWNTIYDSSVDTSPNSDGTHHEVEDSTPHDGFTAYRLRIELE